MESTNFRLNYVLCLIVVSFACISTALVTVVENAKTLCSSEFGYPNNTDTLDVIWLFNHSIRLHLHEFHLNGHDGDFVLISELPLLNQDYFKNISGTDDSNYIEKLSQSILSDQALLLSWRTKKTFEAVNEQGTFVLFHAEPKDDTSPSAVPFKGFDIEVVNYDFAITTTTSTTPDPYVPPKGEETYITKFLNCKEPKKFLRELKDFKQKIARLATQFCKETNNKNCLEKGDISYEEVNVPGANLGTYAGLHYCDPTWSNYATCVEVTFSILRTDNQGNYIYPSNELERMWAEKSHELNKDGYCPYTPPETVFDMNTVVWVAFFLGIIISLTAILSVSWIRRTLLMVEYRTTSINESKKKVEEFKDDTPHHLPHFDKKNPIYNMISGGPYSHVHNVDYDGRSTGPFKKRSTENPGFQDIQADVYAYDNTGFDQEETHVPFPKMDHKRDDAERLIMESENRASLSDTEI